MSQKNTSTRWTCLIITLAYFVVSTTWTLISNRFFAVLLNRPELAENPTGHGHWVFILLSTGLLYWLLRYWEYAIAASEDSLRKVNRSLRTFSECSKAMMRHDDELALMQSICQICVEVGGHRMAWVAYGDEGAEQKLIPMASWGASCSYLENLQATWADDELGQGPAGTCIRSGQIMIVQNLLTDPRFTPWRDAAKNCGYASCIALPLTDDDRGTYAALVIFNAQINVFDAAEAQLLEELAQDLSYGLRTLRLQAEKHREMDERLMLAKVIDQTSDGVIIFDAAGIIQYINSSFVHLCCGIPASEGIGVSIHDFACFERNRDFYQTILGVFSNNETVAGHFINRHQDGTEYDIDTRISPVFGSEGEVVRYVATLRDVSQEVGLQRQLRQAQKMEALATLSGGIAHDFNNILAIIMTNVEMTLEDSVSGTPQHQSLELALKASLRGKNLVKQFLTISRQSEQPHSPVRLEQIVDDCFELLRATLPTTIELRKDIDGDPGMIAADPTQINQVIMNLCTNAGDAMREGGGILNISIQTVTLRKQDLGRYPGLKAGRYLSMVVADTGHGMDREVLDRIFDPFYTTKAQGKGTGLGLSTAHGIIKNHGGHISVNSIVAVGTTFSILLPRLEDQAVEAQPLPTKVLNDAGQGHILLVDDEVDYVAGMQQALQRCGYQVTAETDGRKTLEQFRADPQRYGLLIADQTMPQMTGMQLAREILALRPDLPVVICSGSAPDAESEIHPARVRAAGVRKVLMKPVSRKELTQVVEQFLGDPRHGADPVVRVPEK